MTKPEGIRTLVVNERWGDTPPINEVGTIKINLEGRLVDAEVLGIEATQNSWYHPCRLPNLQKYPTANLIVRGDSCVIGCEPARSATPYLYLHVPELDKLVD